jgi:hypothetical protein
MLSKKTAIIFILLSAIASYAIANLGVYTGNMEMGAIAFLFGPPIIGLATLVIFLLLDWIFPKIRVIIMVLLIIGNLATGIALRLSS